MSENKNPKVIVIDRNSGRGHAVCDLFVRTNLDVEVIYAPGCTAIKSPRITSIPEISLSRETDYASKIVDLAKREKVNFVFIANATALDDGLADKLRGAEIPTIGPDRAAARLESSKVYAKDLCAKYGIPIAEYQSFSDPVAAKEYVTNIGHNVVVKADGLCGGMGSHVCSSPQEAINAIDKIMVEKKYRDAGNKVVIEKRLYGIELSFSALYDGNDFLMLPMALDYKRSDDGDTGINCGGMGSLSPHPLECDQLINQARDEILMPLKQLIKQEGLQYNGVIYVGAMLSEERLKVLEFNVRLGDSEAQVILPRIQSDFVEVCEAVIAGKLANTKLNVSDQHYCDVVMAQGRTQQFAKNGTSSKGWLQGWPYGRYGLGYKVSGLDTIDNNSMIYFGNIGHSPEKGYFTDGARVLHVVGTGSTKESAITAAYDNLGRVHFDGARYRRDIGSFDNSLLDAYTDALPLRPELKNTDVTKDTKGTKSALPHYSVMPVSPML